MSTSSIKSKLFYMGTSDLDRSLNFITQEILVLQHENEPTIFSGGKENAAKKVSVDPSDI